MNDKKLIYALGGVAALSKKLGYKGTSCVGNWVKRGIPSKVKLNNQSLFAKAEKQLKAANE